MKAKKSIPAFRPGFLFVILWSVVNSLLPTIAFSQSNRLWATYYGGTGNEVGYSVATDGSGNVYLAGETKSPTGISSGGFQNTYGGGFDDAFLVKFDTAGNRLWATYYGGTGFEDIAIIATDVVGNIYLAGWTTSASGIASGGFQNTYAGGYDAFLVKFNASGTRLWATYYGGTSSDYGRSVATDALGNVYLAGITGSTLGIASGGFQNTTNGGDAFLVKFDAAGNRLWATYYGGTGIEYCESTTTDALGNVYLSGWTTSTANIASIGFQNAYAGGWDAFLVKFDGTTGNRLWATYYGGSGEDQQRSLVTDASGNIYLSGVTTNTVGIASSGFQNIYGGGLYDAFLVKFSPSGGRIWATYYGGSGDDYGHSVATDVAGNLYWAGRTNTASGIASGGFQNVFGGGTNDAFLVKFDASGSRLCATYYGGTGIDYANSVTTDLTGNVYLSGLTNSVSNIGSGGFQNTFGGYLDAYLVKFTSYGTTPILSATTTSTNILCNGKCTGTGTVSPVNGTGPYTYIWSAGGQNTQTATGLCEGTYTVTITDVTGTTTTASVTITQPLSALSGSVTSNNASCIGQCNGNATVLPSGGTPGYTYSWNTVPIQINTNASNLCAGNYIATVTDANGCTTIKTVTIIEPTAITSTITLNPATCAASNGNATVTSTGGTGTLTYTWSPTGGNTPNATALAAGNYTVSIMDTNGCLQTQTVSIASVNTLSISTSSTPASCTSATGSATANPSGGSPVYIYNWSNGQTTQSSTGLATGSYTVTITDANTCTQTQTVTVTSNNTLTLSTSSTQTGCTASNGTAMANPGNGITPYTYSWNNNQTSQTATGLAAGNYTITVTDGSGCTQTQMVSVTKISGPTATANASPLFINSGDSAQLIAGGSGIYQWSPANGLNCITCSNPTATPLQTTTYCVVVTDANSCTDVACVTISVENVCKKLFLPNAFSPNHDGENDVFCLQGDGHCIQKLEIVIYDRWGEKVYESADPKFCWDGTYEGTPLNTSVFVYYLSIGLTDGSLINKKGNISLIR